MTTGRPGTGPRATKPRKPHPDIIDGPALPVPPPRFVPVAKEPMRRSTRAERMEEIHEPFRRFLTPCNVPTSEMTEAERKRYNR